MFCKKKNTSEIENTIEGRIETLMVDGMKFDYYGDFETFFVNSHPQNTYSLVNNRILLPVFSKDKTIQVIYYTKNCAEDSEGTEKFLL